MQICNPGHLHSISVGLAIAISLIIILGNLVIITVMPVTNLRKQFIIISVHLAASDFLTGVSAILRAVLQTQSCVAPKLVCRILFSTLLTIVGSSFTGIFNMSLYSFILVKYSTQFDKVLTVKRSYIICISQSLYWSILLFMGITLAKPKSYDEDYTICVAHSKCYEQWYIVIMAISYTAMILSSVISQLATLFLIRSKRRPCILPVVNVELASPVAGISSSDGESYSMTKAFRNRLISIDGIPRTTTGAFDTLKVPKRKPNQMLSLPNLERNNGETVTKKHPGNIALNASPSKPGCNQAGVSRADVGKDSNIPHSVYSQTHYKILTKYAWMTSLVVLSLVICWMPKMIVIFVLNFCESVRIIETAKVVDHYLSLLNCPLLNSVINLFIYVGKDADFRYACYNVFCLFRRPSYDFNR